MTDVTPSPRVGDPVAAPAADPHPSDLPADATPYTHATLVARVDNIERQVRQWVAEEVAATIARLRATLHAPAEAVPPAPVDTSTPSEAPTP